LHPVRMQQAWCRCLPALPPAASGKGLLCILPISLPTHAPSCRHGPCGMPWVVMGGLQLCPGPHLASLLSVRLRELPSALLGDVCLSHHLSSKRRAVCWCIDSTDAFCHACTSCCTCIPVLNAALLLIIPPCGLRAPCCALCAAHQQRAAHGAQTPCNRCCCTTAYVQHSSLLLSGATGLERGCELTRAGMCV
jgi:hypothetical protein